MSNITEKAKYPPDMTPKEIADLERFISDGTPGLTLTPEQVSYALQLYINGASYHELSIKLSVKKYIITYYATRHGFYETKIATLEGLAQVVNHKMDIVGVKGMDLMVDVMSSLEVYYKDILNRYMLTRDPRIIENTDFENFKMFMKCMETIQKIKNPDDANKNKTSSMGLNLPNGGILKKIDDNTVEVSPLTSPTEGSKLGEVLKTLAELREKRESK